MARRKHPDGIDGLVEKGRAQGYVTYDELNSALPPDVLTGDQIDDVMEIFGANAIEVVDDFQKVPLHPGANLLIGEEEAAEEEESSVEEEPAVEEEEFGYPGGVKGNDPVRLYLKEMGAIHLLNREGEVSLAKRIEDGEREIVSAVKGCSIALDDLFHVGDMLKAGEVQVRDVIKDLDEDSTEEEEKAALDKVLRIIQRIRKTHLSALEIEQRLRKGRLQEKDRQALKARYASLNERVVESIQEIHLKERQIEIIGDKIRRFAGRIEIPPEEGEAPRDRGDPQGVAEHHPEGGAGVGTFRGGDPGDARRHRTGGAEGPRSQAGTGRGEPPAGGIDREEVHQPGPTVPGPHPGGEHRPDEGRGQVRVPPGVQVLHLCHVVDPPGDHAGDRRPGAYHPDPRSYDRNDQQAHPDFPVPGAGARAGAQSRRDRRADGHPAGEGPQGPEDRQGADLPRDADRGGGGQPPRRLHRGQEHGVAGGLGDQHRPRGAGGQGPRKPDPPRGAGSPDAVRDRREVRPHPRGGGAGLRGEGAAEAAPPQPEQAAADVPRIGKGRIPLTPSGRAEDNERMTWYFPGRAHSSVGQSHRLITGRSLVRGQVGPPMKKLPRSLA